MSPVADTSVAEQCAAALRDAFLTYDDEFRAITRRARTRFEQCDWLGGQRDAAERIGLYDGHVDASTVRIRALLGERVHDRRLWARIKAAFEPLCDDIADVEFAKTYFSSVTRRIFGTRGVEPGIEFVGEETIPLRNIDGPLVGNNYLNTGTLRQLFRVLLDDYAWSVPFVDADRCAARLAAQVTEHFRRFQGCDSVVCVDVLRPVFYRGTRAYVIGRATGWTCATPLVIAFANTGRGIAVDAVLQSEEDVSVMFGFARSYFHADVHPVGAAIVFLRKVLPRQPVNELFTILGRAKQGKTERYRGLARHLAFSSDRFITAPGKKGLVMLVFTLPSYDVVFKVIRDRFAFPKDTTPEEVKRRYRLVASHNLAGRLVDAQEFRMLRLDRHRFEPALLDELVAEAGRSIAVDGDSVVVEHVYVERRLRPLDLYLREVERKAAIRAVLDYGAALRDLAATNVFPGDLLTKNFGVSRSGRVIFYDYDEICLLTECRFRDMPRPRTHEDEFGAEPWFSVGPQDVFPEEFPRFLGFDDELVAVFEQVHGELFTAQFWRQLQDRIRAGEVIEVLPY